MTMVARGFAVLLLCLPEGIPCTERAPVALDTERAGASFPALITPRALQSRVDGLGLKSVFRMVLFCGVELCLC